jgi:hypothetical protein
MTTPVHDNLKKCMSEKDRKALEASGDLTWPRCLERADVKNEAELQRQIVGWLKSSRGVRWVIWSRTDKPTRTQVGTPDICFVVQSKRDALDGVCVAVAFEVKIGDAKLRPEQDEAAKAMILDGWKWAKIRSLKEAKDFLDNL